MVGLLTLSAVMGACVMALDVSLIRAGSRVRLVRGTLIHSTNPKAPTSAVTRPYWITVDHIDEDGRAVWIAAGGYYAFAPLTAFDSIEAY